MKWEGQRQSDNVEDRRDGGGGLGGGGGGRRIGGRGVGLGTLAIAVVAGWIFGINPLTVLGLLGGGGPELAPQRLQHRQAIDQVQAQHLRRVTHRGQVVGAVPALEQRQVLKQRVDLVVGQVDGECRRRFASQTDDQHR